MRNKVQIIKYIRNLNFNLFSIIFSFSFTLSCFLSFLYFKIVSSDNANHFKMALNTADIRKEYIICGNWYIKL